MSIHLICIFLDTSCNVLKNFTRDGILLLLLRNIEIYPKHGNLIFHIGKLDFTDDLNILVKNMRPVVPPGM